ncbi:uncharacterized protein LOC107788892 isoform X1 [Nicotiana tabacum]|uniref:Probable serine/threonine-protein kinase DDB_G0282963 isoform X1 n=1 Tax=Nicotiana tabacum TaxID=4097 RepID=A0A1S3ZNJ4_TOBAC|nr:probable serine/threonine-protein kinase DDB_G0282963 isoform X1 [Nicotiana tomentosiformis]XP_016466109.1 PREDICTED: probable serine/threonine-protein kinase DDB_G0282963 isoform X1 [Nicotiana tabacum]XP_016466110.1 PREDICTED: probable serine/threonine-protein kinase DDB_G0282963 isoform X1 [Nicotiana tabacum]
MAEDDDDSFGDFTFASTNSLNTQFTLPPKSIDPSAEDDEWGDFVEHPSGSEPSTASSLTQSKPFDPFGNSPSVSESGWVKPCGALPLSLFGEAEAEDDDVDKEKQKPAEENTNTKVRNNGSNSNLGYGFDSVISNLYNQDHNLKSQNGSLSNSNKLVGLNSVKSNSKDSAFQLNGSGFDPNSGSPCVSRVQSLNYLASLNEEVQQIKTGSTNVSNSNFSMLNPDFDLSKSNQNGLDRTLSVDAVTSLNDQCLQIKTKSTGFDFESNASSSSANFTSSSFGVWNPVFHVSKSNQNGLNRTLSLDGLTNLNDHQSQQIKTESGVLVPNSNGYSSSVNAPSSTLSGWDFDFGGFGSDAGRSISTASPDISGLNSNFNAVGSSENLNDAHNNNDDNDDDDDGWEFKDAYSMSTVKDGNNKATSEAKELQQTNASSFAFHNGLNGSVDLFATSNGSVTADSKAHHAGDMKAYSSGFGNSLNGSIDLFSTPNEPIDLFATSSDGRGEQKESNDSLDPHPVVGSAETDEDFGDFTTAFSDSGLKPEEEWKVNDVTHYELQASECDDKDQVKELKLENHKGALPLSIFGDEEQEIDGSSNIEDIFVPHNASYSKNDRSPDSNISINDLISNLYSQAEQISPAHSVQVPNSISDNPQDLVSNSNLVNGEDDLDDGEWEFKDGSSQMRTDNDTSLLTSDDPPKRSFSKLNLDNYLDLYSKLRKELCYHAKRHLDELKRAQSIDGLPVEEAKISTLNKEIEEACKDIDLDNAMCKDGHMEGHLHQNACMSAFIEILQEPEFQILESDYQLSRRLSLVENDLETTVDLVRHATMMLKILRSGSLEEQSIYVSVWYKMISVCAQELQHGSCIWKKILEMNAQSHMLSLPRGRAFVRALGEIYRVTVVLEASVKLCKPWIWSNSAQCTSIHSMLDECHTMWSSLGLGEAVSSMLDSASSGDGSSVASLLDSIKLIHSLDALTLQKHLYAQKEVCRLSLLTLEVLPGLKLIDWNGEHYFLTLANLWANLISSDPPELPHLTIGW